MEAHDIIMVVVVAVVDTNPLLLVLLHQNFIVLTSLERPPYFFHGRLPHPSQGSVLRGVQLDITNGINHPHIIGILTVAIAVPLVPVLAVSVTVCPPYNYCPHCRHFPYLMMGSVKCVHFVPQAI